MIALLSYFLFMPPVQAQELTVQTMDMVRRKYLWLEDLEVETALISAAEELEMHIPWIIVQQQDHQISLHVGQQEAFYTTDTGDVTFDNIEVKLFEIMLGVTKASPMELPEDLDVELLLLDGFAREMDRYSIMMYKDRLSSFNERISGKFSGIGCRVQKREQGLEIQEVFPDGPASLMGLKEGDIVTSVDDIPLGALTLQQGVDRLRGETGSVVSIQYLRDEQVRDMSLVRGRVRIPNVHWTIQDNVGIITIRSFSEQTTRFMEQALEEFDEEKITGIVVDLRNNGGGSMLQSCKVVDRFVTSGTTIKTVGKDGKPVPGLMKQYVNRNSFTEPKVPMVVLINSNSASASEIVSGSLKLLDRALLIGQRSFGKGVVQTAAELRGDDNPVALKLTIAQYLLTGDYSVHEQDGVEPHVKVGMMDVSELPFVSLSPEPSDLLLLDDGDGKDKQLAFAVDVLKHATSPKVERLQEVAKERIQIWKGEEQQAIEASMLEYGVEWGDSETDGVQDIRIEMLSENIGKAGEQMTLRFRLHNSGGKITQSLLWLQAENSSSPWDDVVVPVGVIPSLGYKDIDVPLDIPHDTVPRYDKIQPVLLRSCCAEVELNPLFVQVAEGERATVALTGEVKRIDGNEYQFQLTTTNTGVVPLTEVTGRVIWPVEARQVRMLKNEWTIPELLPNTTHTETLTFVSYDNVKDLPEVLLRVDAEDHNRLFRQPVSPVRMTQLIDLYPPVVHGIPAVSGDVGTPLIFEHVVEDDGVVAVYEAWFNNEKIHWQDRGGQIQLSLNLEVGHNNLYIEVIDDLGLQQKQVFTIFGLASEGGETHLGKDSVESEIGQE